MGTWSEYERQNRSVPWHDDELLRWEGMPLVYSLWESQIQGDQLSLDDITKNLTVHLPGGGSRNGEWARVRMKARKLKPPMFWRIISNRNKGRLDHIRLPSNWQHQLDAEQAE